MVWIYGALTQMVPSHHTAGSLRVLNPLDHAYPHSDLSIVANHLASHLSGPMPDGLAGHPRIQHSFIPVGIAWLNLIEGGGRLGRIFRRKTFAGRSLANGEDIAYAIRIATAHLNRHASPWVWGRSPPAHRSLLRRFVSHR